MSGPNSSGVRATSRLVVGITGASGALYAARLLELLAGLRLSHDLTIHAVASSTAPEVFQHELGRNLEAFMKHYEIPLWAGRDYNAPFASGSAQFEAMVVVPASMSSVARIAHGISDDLLTRAADVMLKERRTLILVARESPLSTIHLENLLTCSRAGALILPAMPSFYGKPDTIDEVILTVLGRVFDHLGFELAQRKRWGENALPAGQALGATRTDNGLELRGSNGSLVKPC